MKNQIRVLLLVAIIIGICCILKELPAVATQSQIDEVKDNISQLEEEQEKNQQELEDLEADKAYLDGKLAKLNSQLSATARELTNIQKQLEIKETDILANTQQLEEAREKEAEQYEDMKKRIRFLYERGETDLLELILEAESFADIINISEYMVSIHMYDRKMLDEYRQVKEDISNREVRLWEEQQELLALAKQQEEKLEQVKILLAEVTSNLNNTNQQIAGTEQEILENKEQIEKQKAYEAKLEAKKAEEDAKRLEEIKKQESENQGPLYTTNSESEIAMLAALIECEAVGESYEGKLAVGSVVMNRIRSAYFPNTLVEVIYEAGQFSPVASGRFAVVLSRGAEESCVQAAKETLSGTITNNCLFFRRNNGTIDGLVIGNHVFY